MRVVVADDSMLLREGLVRLLTEAAGEVVRWSPPSPMLDGVHRRGSATSSTMAEDRSDGGIADALVITGWAVEKHVSNIFARINLPDLGSENRRVLAVLTWLKAR